MQSFVQEESSHGVRVFWLEQERLIEELKKKAMEVGKRDANVQKILLFGSIAEGRGVPGSDADLLIILHADSRKFPDRIPEWQEKMYIGFPMDVFPYTEEETKNPIVKEALIRGILLYSKQDHVS